MLDNAQETCNRAITPDAHATFSGSAPCGRRWFAIFTGHGHAQLTADIEIRLAGFEVFNPSIWQPAYSARLNRPGKPDRIAPLFPRYLFAAWQPSDPWFQICSRRGVEAILGETPSKPTPVPDEVIQAIRDRAAPNGCIYPAEPRHIAVGDRARITRGSFVDMTGICTMSNTRRVELLLSVMGRQVSVKMPMESVEAA